jgi:hypothetical protein
MTAAAPAAPATRSTASWSAFGPLIVFAIGVVAIWLPPRPPMIDLPQFAGQIALLKGMLTGSTPWAPNLRLDVVTPYLIGYALALPLAFILPVAAALKLVLTAALAAFGLGAAAIRRELGAARELDAYALIGFFGFVYAWGLYTFLVAAPLGLFLIWLALRYARSPDLRRGLAVSAAGLLLLFAHGLVFIFATGVGLLLMGARAGGPGRAFGRAWPFALPLAACAAMLLSTRAGVAGVAGGGLTFGPPDLRVMGALASIDDRPSPWTIPALIVLLALPLVGGLRITVRPIERLIIAGAVFAALALGPDWAWVASGIYRRFALFAPAAWAWLFTHDDAPSSGLTRLVRPNLDLAASVLAALIVSQHVSEAIAFSRETANFDRVMAMARPGHRALGLVLDEASVADVDLHVYRHFPLWYQAEKGGLVDPSFAASPPSIVRYRQNPPGLYDDAVFADDPSRFDWRRDDGGQWTYFFVRHTQPIPPGLFVGADCPPAIVGTAGAWNLYQSRICLTKPK